MNGVASKRESKRSRKPPWPGINCPLSFTPAILFSLLSIRSPNVPAIAAMEEIPNTICQSIFSQLDDTKETTAMAINAPPTVPSQVFLGEILDSGVLPIKEPTI